MPTTIRSSRMPLPRVQFITGAALAAVVLTGTACSADASPAAGATTTAAVTPPPVKAGFDYQIGSAYTPPAGVKVVSRDHDAQPAAGPLQHLLRQRFPGAARRRGEWDSDLLLRDANGNVVIDEDWNEALLDLRTADKRDRVAAKVEPGSTTAPARATRRRAGQLRQLHPVEEPADRRPGPGLHPPALRPRAQRRASRSRRRTPPSWPATPGQRPGLRRRRGMRTADECGDFTSAFGNHVIVIEYTDSGLKACSGWSTLSVVQRDVDVRRPGKPATSAAPADSDRAGGMSCAARAAASASRRRPSRRLRRRATRRRRTAG